MSAVAVRVLLRALFVAVRDDVLLVSHGGAGARGRIRLRFAAR